eukprot:479731-Alexandrium_andersonii.AAC.1
MQWHQASSVHESRRPRVHALHEPSCDGSRLIHGKQPVASVGSILRREGNALYMRAWNCEHA